MFVVGEVHGYGASAGAGARSFSLEVQLDSFFWKGFDNQAIGIDTVAKQALK